MKTPRIHFVNRFYWPEHPATGQLLADLAEALAARGHRISVQTRLPPGSEAVTEEHAGVSITRVRATGLGRFSLAGRAVDFLSYLAGVRRRLQETLQAGDIVVAMTDPPMLGAAVTGLVRSRGAKPIHWVQDIFPEVATAVSGVKAANLLRGMRDRAWRAAVACVVPGADMAALVRSRGVPGAAVRVCENWAPAGVRRVECGAWRAEHGLSDAFVLMYSGNLGRVHSFEAVVPVARLLASEPRIQLVFVGGGARLASLQREVSAAGLGNLRFLPAQPRSRLAETLSAGDLHLVTLRRGCESLVFPSKLYGITGVARPVLALAPDGSELAQLVHDHHLGAAFSGGDPASVAAFVRTLAGADPEARRRQEEALDRFAAPHRGPARAAEVWHRLLLETTG